ncbi:DMT family transporter [Pokkaliibacter sp. CJK22405]|uniref:DMT family transporter n=1 Tax=Pokkaliibacter sp. CJK22405 TaxID=3384615 RepID=UPI003984D9EE
MKSVLGSLLILCSAVGFGGLALFAHEAYAAGVDTSTLLAMRFGIAAVVLVAVIIARRYPWPKARAMRGYIIMGVLYAITAWSYFKALNFATSGTVSLLLYTSPVMVTVASAILGLERFGKPEWLALCGVSIGLFFLLGTGLQSTIVGVLLGLNSALVYTFYILLGSRIGAGSHPISSSTVVVISAGIIFLGLSLWNGVHLPSTPRGWGAVTMMAVMGTLIGILTFVAGLNLVGPTIASVLSTIEPVITMFLGVTFLGEFVGGGSMIGAALILLASTGLAVHRLFRERSSQLPLQQS